MKSQSLIHFKDHQQLPLLPVYSDMSTVREEAKAQIVSHLPWAMLTLSIAQCALFCWYVSGSDQVLADITESAWPFSAYRSIELWRLFSYALVHVEFNHLICNVSVEIALGAYLEKTFGCFHTVCVFALGALTGSLAVGILNENDILIGASAGVCALIAAVASKHFYQLFNRHFSFCSVWWIVMFLLTVIVDVSSLMQSFNSLHNERSHFVAYFSHLGGSLAGLIYGGLHLTNTRGSQLQTVTWWSVALGYATLLSSALMLILIKSFR
uniref:Rhomboid domain-containing protein n=1 Tax=Steinernema glaseri TaxID=37863 RepID=A0A1I8A408_9BILA